MTSVTVVGPVGTATLKYVCQTSPITPVNTVKLAAAPPPLPSHTHRTQ